MKEVQLCFVLVAPLTPFLQACGQQALLNIRGFHRHDYHKVGEKLLLQHVLHFLGIVREALQNKTCRPARWSMFRSTQVLTKVQKTHYVKKYLGKITFLLSC